MDRRKFISVLALFPFMKMVNDKYVPELYRSPFALSEKIIDIQKSETKHGYNVTFKNRTEFIPSEILKFGILRNL